MNTFKKSKKYFLTFGVDWIYIPLDLLKVWLKTLSIFTAFFRLFPFILFLSDKSGFKKSSCPVPYPEGSDPDPMSPSETGYGSCPSETGYGSCQSETGDGSCPAENG